MAHDEFATPTSSKSFDDERETWTAFILNTEVKEEEDEVEWHGSSLSLLPELEDPPPNQAIPPSIRHLVKTVSLTSTTRNSSYAGSRTSVFSRSATWKTGDGCSASSGLSAERMSSGPTLLSRLKGLFVALSSLSVTVTQQELNVVEFRDVDTCAQHRAGFCHLHPRIFVVAAQHAAAQHVQAVAKGVARITWLLTGSLDPTPHQPLQVQYWETQEGKDGPGVSSSLNQLLCTFVDSSFATQRTQSPDHAPIPGRSPEPGGVPYTFSEQGMEVSVALRSRLEALLAALEARRSVPLVLAPTPPGRQSLPVGACLFVRGVTLVTHLAPEPSHDVALLCTALGLFHRDRFLPSGAVQPFYATLSLAAYHTHASRMLAVACEQAITICSLIDSPPACADEEARAEVHALSDLLSRLSEEGFSARLSLQAAALASGSHVPSGSSHVGPGANRRKTSSTGASRPPGTFHSLSLPLPPHPAALSPAPFRPLTPGNPTSVSSPLTPGNYLTSTGQARLQRSRCRAATVTDKYLGGSSQTDAARGPHLGAD